MTGSAPRTILVVDDNAVLSALVEKYLRREGYRTAHVGDGASALQWLSEQTADLLLVCLKLPDMTGEQVVHALAERGQQIPFLVVAGHGDERQASHMMKRGALDYLMKDGTLLELLPPVVRQAMEQLDRQKLLREAEIAYERLRHQYEMILQAAGDGICQLDMQGRITFVNPAALRILGYSENDLLGRDLAMLAERPNAGGNGQIREALAANTTFRSHDHVFWRKDGSCFPIEMTSTPIRDGQRQIGSVFVFKDISQRRALEEQVRQSQKLEAVGRLAGGVAHDFNNLLTVVSGYSELLAGNPNIDQNAREAVSEIQRAAERAIAVTRQLLAFSRKQLLQPRQLDLNAVVTEITKLIHRLIGEDIALTTRLDPKLAPVRADPGQLEQVILNLAVNARDAMPHGGSLVITTANTEFGADTPPPQPGLRPGRYVVLTVSDTGVGMDVETRARIFEPFFTTKEPGHGTGLGLATVYGIIVQSGGHVEVQSAPKRGTTFRILLPASERTTRSLPITTSRETRTGSETVLLVEDEESVRGLTARVLESYGYNVLQARDGAEAIEIAQDRSVSIQLMLTDVVMPGISGLELAHRLVQFRPDLRVLFMSGYTDDALDRRGDLHRDSTFLPKPFTPETLARRVRDVLDQESSAEPALSR